MPKVRVTRRVHFSAAHRLHNPELSDAENRELFGLCNSPNAHGHNYEMEVTVEGHPDARTGYVIDLKALKETAESVTNELDHRNLNVDVPWLAETVTSTENLVVAIWERLRPRISRGELVRIRLWETPRNMVEYTGS